MKNIVAISIILLLSGFSVFAQVGINTDNSPPDQSSMLDVKSANKGFLPPRVALTALNIPDPIVTPAVGLIIYNIANAGTSPNDVSAGYYWWNGMKWISVSAPQGTSAGDMLYWNGTQWVNVPVGINGQSLILNNGVPTWGNPSAQAPSLITNAVSGITNISAVSGGNVSDGGAPVTVRGVCWGISPNPAISGNKTTDGSGPGLFTSDLTGLAANTTYYARAYATNSEGTSYGNEVSFTTSTFVIGQSFGGGIIFYIDGTGQHVLISSTSDQGVAPWGCKGTLIPISAYDMSGQSNTLAIADGCSTIGIAARICSDLVLNGFDDWFLPSADEMSLLYNQRNMIGGFTNGFYWSSSQENDSYALAKSFGVYFNSRNKDSLYNVRAIRAFPSVAPPTVTTAPASNITPSTATTGGDVTSAGGATVVQKGVCYGTSSNPNFANSTYTVGSGTGPFVVILTALLPATLYHVRAFAKNSAGIAYGNDVSFTTPATVPTVITLPVTGITPTGATFGGNVTSDGGSPLIIKSFEYKLIPDINSPGGTVAPNQGTALGIYTWTTDFLRANTVYYVWAQAGNAIGNTTGNMVTFTTLPAVIPTVTTTTVTSITQTTATSGGNITSDGGDWVTARGVCWSTSPTPLISSGNFTLDGPWAGPFVSTITGLTGNTLYYIRAYATNSAGTSYGDELLFTTLPTAPTVVTLPVTGITQTGATFGGNVTSDGGSPVLSRSFLAGTSPDINAASMATANLGPGTGNFTYTWGSFLTPNTVYYVWARAGNSVGNATGNRVSFTTLPAVAPTVTTAPVTNITQTTATSGGTITSDGGAWVSAKGVCWSTSPTPVISSGNFTQDGTGSGPFVSTITGLTGNTTYYVRAYATNSAGTSYGGEDTLTTLPVQGTVATTVVTSIAQTSATGGGTVTSDGGAAVTSRGICWGTASQPTILANSFTIAGSGTGPFTSSMNDLSTGTLYYVRAYVTNSVGTSYGNEVSFTTTSFAIGQTYGGGVIFYLDATGQHGLVSTTSDQSTGTQWGCSNTLIGTSGVFGTGHSNTTAIVNGCATAGIAARICDELVIGEYSDWFLPSKDELNMMYVQRSYIGGFAGNQYWSSTEDGAGNGWHQYFGDGSWGSDGKQSTFRVRAIRAFPNGLLPSVTTPAVTNLTQTTATCGGNVTSDGGNAVTERGVCWSTSPSPTTAGSKLTNGTGTGSFTVNITGLTPATVYYVRAYAINGVGTSYGNEVMFNNTYYIGANYGGGIMFYIDGSGQHGLISAPYDQAYCQWGCMGTVTGATGTGIGNGQANTTAIVNGCSQTGIAARICDDLVLNGFSDWFLPSVGELMEMANKRTIIGGFNGYDYWSSSEWGNNNAQTVVMGWIQNYVHTKSDGYYIRAIRAF